MIQIHPYLHFSGNCQEAMNFYQECLGGKLIFQRIGEVEEKSEMPENMKNQILHATLSNQFFTLHATDLGSDDQIFHPLSLSLSCIDPRETREIFEKLSEGGRKNQDLAYNYWGNLVGELTDKFGNRWILHCTIT